jgi:hypothetical protein
MSSVRFICGVVAAGAIITIGSVYPSAAQDKPKLSPAEQIAKAQSVETPRQADGHPDFTGIWRPAGGGGGCGAKIVFKKDDQGRPTDILFVAPDTDFSKLDAADRACRAAAANQLPYKPDLLEKVKFLDEHTNQYDGALHCMPAGVPRMGAPGQIVSYPGHVVFLYEGDEATINTFRVIPTDGRAHSADPDPSFLGDSVGRWEGDMLVVDVIGFNDLSWISGDGHFHSEAMHVVERFTRVGNSLKYEVTVEDPKVLTRPWVKNPTLMLLNTDPNAALEEDPPCVERDTSHLVTPEHH